MEHPQYYSMFGCVRTHRHLLAKSICSPPRGLHLRWHYHILGTEQENEKKRWHPDLIREVKNSFCSWTNRVKNVVWDTARYSPVCGLHQCGWSSKLRLSKASKWWKAPEESYKPFWISVTKTRRDDCRQTILLKGSWVTAWCATEEELKIHEAITTKRGQSTLRSSSQQQD